MAISTQSDQAIDVPGIKALFAGPNVVLLAYSGSLADRPRTPGAGHLVSLTYHADVGHPPGAFPDAICPNSGRQGCSNRPTSPGILPARWHVQGRHVLLPNGCHSACTQRGRRLPDPPAGIPQEPVPPAYQQVRTRRSEYLLLVGPPAPERRLGRIPTAMPQGLRDELDPAARDQSVLFVPKH